MTASIVHKLAFFCKRVFRFFLIQIIAHEILIYVLHLRILSRKSSIKDNKSKMEESRTLFCRQSIQPWPHQILKWLRRRSGRWSSCKIVQSISYKNPGHKRHSNVAFKLQWTSALSTSHGTCKKARDTECSRQRKIQNYCLLQNVG